ncbi:hypothetical protein ABPG75_007095 [Micractinium tetrahymenae]
MRQPGTALLLLAVCVAAAASTAAVAAAPPLPPAEGEFCSEAGGWEPLPESDPGSPEVPQEVLNATVTRFEDLHATATPPWAHCFEDELNLLVQGCLQEVDGIATYWLRINMTCAREDSEDSADFEAAAVETPEGAVEVLISDMQRLQDGNGSMVRVCQDRACEVCAPLPAGGPNSTLSPSEACLKCVDGMEQDPDTGVCHQGLGGGLAGYAPPPTCPDGTYLDPGSGNCAPCRPGCATCRAQQYYETGNFRGQVCLSCAPPFFLNPRGDCVQQCPQGSYFQFATASCQPCRPGCSACFWCHQNDANCIKWQTCTGCNPNAYFKGGDCLPCNRPGCTTCGPCSAGPDAGCRQGQQCWSCRQPNWYRDGYDCLLKCPLGQYYNSNANQCQPCSRPGCSACKPCNQAQDGPDCQGGQWCTDCEKDWYINSNIGGTCKNCDSPGCVACQRCQTGSPGCLNNQLCWECDTGMTLQQDGSCLKCVLPGCTNCKACAPGDPNCTGGQACTACDSAAGYSLSTQGDCVKQCDPGSYWSVAEGACTPCAEGCTSCRSCADGSQGCENQQICANACQAGYWFDLAYRDAGNWPWGQCRTCTTPTRSACAECRHCAWPPAQPEVSCLPSGTGGSFVCTKCLDSYTLSTDGYNTCIAVNKKSGLVG